MSNTNVLLIERGLPEGNFSKKKRGKRPNVEKYREQNGKYSFKTKGGGILKLRNSEMEEFWEVSSPLKKSLLCLVQCSKEACSLTSNRFSKTNNNLKLNMFSFELNKKSKKT